MSVGIRELEAIRERWRRARTPLRVIDVDSDDFATGGLARFVEDVGVRFLILPVDPDAHLVRFDSDFWQWWTGDHPNPFPGGRPTNLGTQAMPTAQAAVRFEQRNGRWEWFQYSAIHRNGALELGLGHEGVREGHSRTSEPARGFHLVRIVGRVWHALSIYRDLRWRISDIAGPWETTVALVNTHDSMLGNVARGWADFGDFRHSDLPRCQESNLLLREEIHEWPDAEELMELAFKLAEMVEDAWAVRDRRWLIAHGHDDVGKFDVGRY